MTGARGIDHVAEMDHALRQLWARAPLTPEAVETWARPLCRTLGDADPEDVPERLEMLLWPHLDDDKIGALAAALGLHPDVRDDGTIADRLNDYAALIAPPGEAPASSRTMWTWAEKGSRAFAAAVVGGLVRDQKRWRLHLLVTGSADDLVIDVTPTGLDEPTPIVLTFESETVEVSRTIQNPTIVFSAEDADLLNEGRTELRQSDTTRLTGKLDKRGRASLIVAWSAGVSPHVTIYDHTEFANNLSSEIYNDCASVSLRAFEVPVTDSQT